MNDTVSEDVKLDEAGLEAAAIALSGAPFPMDASRRRAERAVRAYLAATKPASPLPGDVTVKALEWWQSQWEGETESRWTAEGAGTRYYIRLSAGRYIYNMRGYQTLEAAKSAAKEHYTNAVLSTIETSPVQTREDGIREALKVIDDYVGWQSPFGKDEFGIYEAGNNRATAIRDAILTLLSQPKPKGDKT